MCSELIWRVDSEEDEANQRHSARRGAAQYIIVQCSELNGGYMTHHEGW